MVRLQQAELERATLVTEQLVEACRVAEEAREKEAAVAASRERKEPPGDEPRVKKACGGSDDTEDGTTVES